ncbi:MAG: hypothetical protein JWL77_5093 [Chthonomonadaceae bacterium]|nr:hypothetical protein [Chthonomonadaceae bacterium]
MVERRPVVWARYAMRQQRKVVLCLCVILGAVAYAGYHLAPAADDLIFSSSLLAETRSDANLGTADFLVDAGSFAGNKTYFFVRDPAISAGQPVCAGGSYGSDGPIKMQDAVWSKDGSVIAVRVQVGVSDGHKFSRYDGAFWIDAYDFRTHRAVVDGVKLAVRSQVIETLLKGRGGASPKTLSAPSIVGRSLKASERRKYDTIDKDYRPVYNSDEGVKK